MKEVFDLAAAISDGAASWVEATGTSPTCVTLSRGSYRRLLEMIAQENAIGNLVIGTGPILELETEAGTLRVVIDEMLADTVVEIS